MKGLDIRETNEEISLWIDNLWNERPTIYTDESDEELKKYVNEFDGLVWEFMGRVNDFKRKYEEV